jgi:hypothetical protein
MVDGARARAYLRLGGLAQDGVGEGADGVGRRRAIRRAVVLARDEVAHRYGDGRKGALADAGPVVLRALPPRPATRGGRLEARGVAAVAWRVRSAVFFKTR